ncbi:MAG: peptidylprolyl isomerase [Janthinobacterium lividum]
MRLPIVLTNIAAILLLGAAAPLPAPAILTPQQIVDAAPSDAWQPVPPENLLVMDLDSGQRIVLQLAPEFAPIHVANIRSLARAHWWDGAGIVRVQDNYVVQWARMPEGQALPKGIDPHPPAEYDRPSKGLALRPLGYPDSYVPHIGYVDGWPVASDGTRSWLTHCYGMVGVGRDMPPDTGTGEELYAVNGQAPRQLDRNIALVGRVVDGMPVLGALPRGTAALGFYADPKQWVPIRTVQVAADMPVAERPNIEAMRTGSAIFTQYLDARANRRDPFFVRPASGVDLCNAPVPIRLVP